MADIDLRFIGTGDAYNTDGRANQAVLISNAASSFLIDAGPTTLLHMKKSGLMPERLTGIFITHFHGDHTAGVPFILLDSTLRAKSTKLPFIAGPTGLTGRMTAICDALFPGENLASMVRMIEIDPVSRTDLEVEEKITLRVLPMKHKPESIGYRFSIRGKTISMTGDTGMNDNIFELFESADMGIIECSTVEPEKASHISVRELKESIDRFNCRTIVPIHGNAAVTRELELWAHPLVRIVGDGSLLKIS